MTVIGLGLALMIVAVPTASAAHSGPCTHEWAEIALYAYDGLKQGGVKGAAGNAGQGAMYCVDATLDWLGIQVQLP